MRGATARGDGAGVVHLLTGRPWPGDSLQLIGDGLLVALRHQAQGAGGLAARCAGLLRTRDWDGDEEPADAPQAGLGTAPIRLLKPLAVDLEELGMVLEGDPVSGGGRIDLRTGEVWPQSAIDYAIEVAEIGEDADDPDRWFWVRCEGSRAGYQDMVWFISDVDDPGVADRLRIAIRGGGRSGGSRTPCQHRPSCWRGGSPSPRTANAGPPGPGWPAKVTPPARRSPARDESSTPQPCRLSRGGTWEGPSRASAGERRRPGGSDWRWP